MSDLKTRTRYTNSIDTEILNKIKEISKITNIPQSKLVDEAFRDLIVKYKKTLKLT